MIPWYLESHKANEQYQTPWSVDANITSDNTLQQGGAQHARLLLIIKQKMLASMLAYTY